jgi:hypothetical protein
VGISGTDIKETLVDPYHLRLMQAKYLIASQATPYVSTVAS